MPLTIFISYSKSEAVIAARVRTKLTESNFAIWIDDEQIVPGREDSQDWDAAIRRGITACDVLLYLASPAARESFVVKSELLLAQRFERRIIPMWVDGEHWIDAVPIFLGAAQYIDARGDRFEGGMARLLDILPPQESSAVSLTKAEDQSGGKRTGEGAAPTPSSSVAVRRRAVGGQLFSGRQDEAAGAESRGTDPSGKAKSSIGTALDASPADLHRLGSFIAGLGCVGVSAIAAALTLPGDFIGTTVATNLRTGTWWTGNSLSSIWSLVKLDLLVYAIALVIFLAIGLLYGIADKDIGVSLLLAFALSQLVPIPASWVIAYGLDGNRFDFWGTIFSDWRALGVIALGGFTGAAIELFVGVAIMVGLGVLLDGL